MTTTVEPFWAKHAELAGGYRDRDEWLELRRKGIGSSDCSAVLGLGKYGSPFSVWLDKTGRSKDEPETEVMMWGSLLEPVIRAELARRMDVEIVECPMLRSTGRPWQLYSPDGLIPSLSAVVEIKNATGWLAQEWADGQIPDHAELQVHHAMAVTGADGAYVAGLIGGNRLRWEYVPRDDRLIDIVNDAERHMWETYILPDVEPPIDGSDATAEAIAQRWPRLYGIEKLADDVPAVLEAIGAYHAAHAAVKLAESQKAQAVNHLAFMLQGADALVDATGRKLVALKRGQFREKAFREEESDADLWLKKVEVVDRDLLKIEQPELFRRYQAASVYIPKGS